MNGCAQGQDVKCFNSEQSCKALSYTHQPNLLAEACLPSPESPQELAVRSSTPFHYSINSCSSSLLPISCASGECVSRVSECPTCLYICEN
jgi:hypothetical protein